MSARYDTLQAQPMVRPGIPATEALTGAQVAGVLSGLLYLTFPNISHITNSYRYESYEVLRREGLRSW